MSALKKTIKDKYKWNIKGNNWSLDELRIVYKTGQDIENYVDDLTGSKGLKWMNAYIGDVNISISMFGRGKGIPGRILLPQEWATDFDSDHYLAHELAHIWDIRTGHVTVKGAVNGPGDWLNTFIKGDVVSQNACRFCDKSGAAHIPDAYEYTKPGSLYGNNSTADYLADSFANIVYLPGNIPNQNVTGWINSAIIFQTNYLP